MMDFDGSIVLPGAECSLKLRKRRLRVLQQRRPRNELRCRVMTRPCALSPCRRADNPARELIARQRTRVRAGSKPLPRLILLVVPPPG